MTTNDGLNSKAMTVEDRIVQKMKTDTLASLIGDEDAIADLAKRAIYEALFQPRRVPKTYGGYDEADSPIVAACRAAATKAAEAIVERIVSDPEVSTRLVDLAARALPAEMMSAVRSSISNTMNRAVEDGTMELRAAVARFRG